MPYAIKIDPSARIGLVVGSGLVNGAELTDACQKMVQQPEWEPGFDEAWDLTGAREIDITPDELTALVASAHEYAAQIGQSRCVFIHTRDGVQAVLRLFELLTQDLDRTYHTVRSREEAADWLGLAPEVLERPEDQTEPS